MRRTARLALALVACGCARQPPPPQVPIAVHVDFAAVLLAVAPLATQQPPSEPRTVHHAAGFEIEVVGELKGFALDVNTRRLAEGLEVLALTLTSPEPQAPPRLTLRWSLPSHDLGAHWMTGRYLNKTIRPDWAGSRLQASMFAREAPVSALVTGDDRNLLTFAWSDALNTVQLGSGVREEDGLIYNDVQLFTERHPALREFRGELRLDRRPVPYEQALGEVAAWWAAQPGYEPAAVPEPARRPVYSTWYSYHQKVDSAALLKEAAAAKALGFDTIIVDDGWQTLDSARGYAFTGDWQPERMPDMKAFVEGCHRAGMKVVLWYAVPFVGKSSRAAERFKDKSLRFEDRLGAYVLDPRYPEVRAYLVETYARAVREWGVDGFKLDFIERFTADERTVLEAGGGRDHASVNEAADRLMTDVLAELRRLRPEIMIEFRQPYIGPLIRKYGNMFRASDCPNSYLANRVKTVDLRLLTGDTAVHADMVMWHYREPVEKAALQLLNVLFSVPQVSVRLGEIPADHLEMVRFYTGYWNENRDALLEGSLRAAQPAGNYPVVTGTARDGRKQVIAVYGDAFVALDGIRPPARLDVVNAKSSQTVMLAPAAALGPHRYLVRDCRGRVVRRGRARLDAGVHPFQVPPSGVITFEKQ
jgi:alpha-galactosidase